MVARFHHISTGFYNTCNFVIELVLLFQLPFARKPISMVAHFHFPVLFRVIFHGAHILARELRLSNIDIFSVFTLSFTSTWIVWISCLISIRIEGERVYSIQRWRYCKYICLIFCYMVNKYHIHPSIHPSIHPTIQQQDGLMHRVLFVRVSVVWCVCVLWSVVDDT